MKLKAKMLKVEKKRKKARIYFSRYVDIVQSLSVFFVLFIVMTIIFPHFLTVNNLTNIMKQNTMAWVVAAATTIVIIGGEFDISVGSVVAFSGICCGVLLKSGYPIIICVIVALLIGIGFGFFNGTLVTKGNIPSFIVTLSSLFMARGLSFVVTQGFVVSGFPEKFAILGQGAIFRIPIMFLIVVLIYIYASILMGRTRFGRSVYAVGSNPTAAKLSGISVDRVKIICFIITGLTSSFAGVLVASRIMSIQADTARGLEFTVIAAVVIGGTSLRGGRGNVLQTILGVAIIGLIRNGINMSHLNIFWSDFVTGMLILVAVLLDTSRKSIQKVLERRRLLEK